MERSRASSDTSDDESVSSYASEVAVKISDKEIIQKLQTENASLRRQIEDLMAELTHLRAASERSERNQEKMQETLTQLLQEKTGKTVAEKMDTAPAQSSGTKRRAPEDGSSEDEMTKTTPPPTKKTTEKQRRAPDAANTGNTGEYSVLISAPSEVTSVKEGQAAGPNSPPTAAPSSTQTATTPKIPPIILREKDKWSTVSKELATRRLAYTKARLTGEGIQIQTATPDDYRGITRFLTAAKYEHHTYALPEERQLRVVIRGLPDGVSNDDIKTDLQEQGFKVDSVARMTSRRTKQAMPLALVKLPQDQTKVLDVTRCCSLVVRVERQLEARQATQCFRCQRFGHAQSRCTAQAKCVKCGLAHHSHECKKARDVPAKCANCQGSHPASYRGCPRCPKPPTKKPSSGAQRTGSQTTTSQPRATNPPRTTQNPPRTGNPPRTFAEATRNRTQEAQQPQKTTPPAQGVTADSLAAALTQMQQMCSAMSAFFANLPGVLQK